MNDTMEATAALRVENESDTVTRLHLKDREILLIGTAHVSRESAEQVAAAIREEAPDRVCIEIDEGRYQSLTKRDNWQKMDLNKVLREKKGFLLLANLVMSSFQRRVGAGSGTKPGEEMMLAVETSQELGIPFSLSDRPVQMTLQRSWRMSNFWNKMKLLAALISSGFSGEEVDAEEIEALKQKGAIEDMMGELADYLPAVKSVLVDERDQYLATNIYLAEGRKVLAVVGAAHMPGMIRWISDLAEKRVEADLTEISQLPPPRLIGKLLPWLIPLLVAGIFTMGFLNSGKEVGWEMIRTWVLSNGVLAALGALAALAHPLTIIGSFLAAPLTSMNPTIGVGMVTGVMEYFFRKPRVEDMERLQDDVMTFKGWYRNRISRVLLVLLFSSFGSMIGTFIAIIRNYILLH